MKTDGWGDMSQFEEKNDFLWHDNILDQFEGSYQLPTVLDRENPLFRDESPDEIISKATPELFWNDLVTNHVKSECTSKSDSDSGNVSDNASDVKYDDSPPFSPNIASPVSLDLNSNSNSSSSSCSIEKRQLSGDGLVVPEFSNQFNLTANINIPLNNYVTRLVIDDKVYQILNKSNNVDLNNVNQLNAKVPIRSRISTPKKTIKPIKAHDLTNAHQSVQATIDQLESRLLSNSIKLQGSKVQEQDLRAFKKHQRMIKNRESASMSRKRKKEYVTSLEKQLTQLADENAKLKAENSLLRKTLDSFGISKNLSHLNHSLLKLPANVGTIGKNSAFLLGMLLMVSLNIHTFGTYFNKSLPPDPLINNMNIHSRSLLWLDENAQNHSIANASNSHSHNVNEFLNGFNQIPKPPNFMCTNSNKNLVNQTESDRLASELRKWIGRQKNFENASRVNERNFFNHKNILKKNDVRKITNRNPVGHFNWRKTRRRNEVQVFKVTENDYSDFFAHFDKRDDTFYVVSFNADHLLLPALRHNKTSRPKMSLLLPAVMNNGSFSINNEQVTLLKIDCEVTNTNLIEIKQNSIPRNLRSSFKDKNINENFGNLGNNSHVDATQNLNKNVAENKFAKNYLLDARSTNHDRYGLDKYYRPVIVKKYTNN